MTLWRDLSCFEKILLSSLWQTLAGLDSGCAGDRAGIAGVAGLRLAGADQIGDAGLVPSTAPRFAWQSVHTVQIPDNA